MAWWIPVFFLMVTTTTVKAKGRLHGVATAHPQERTINQDYHYTTNNGTITITEYTGLGGNVIIPGTINTLPVTSIGNSAFYSCNRLSKVKIANSVTNIGNDAFRSCTGLTDIMIPTNVASIGDLAFSCCIGLANVIIPQSVTYIGDSAFSYCTGLTNVVIPGSVTSIRCGTFQYCTHLTNITLPNKITSIQYDAFLGCKSLTGVYFKGNAPRLGAHVFDGSSVTVYYLPETSGWSAMYGDRPTASRK